MKKLTKKDRPAKFKVLDVWGKRIGTLKSIIMVPYPEYVALNQRLFRLNSRLGSNKWFYEEERYMSPDQTDMIEFVEWKTKR